MLSRDRGYMGKSNCRGQSLVEYCFVLALIFLVVVSVLMGMGHRSSNRLAAASDALGGGESDGGTGASSSSGAASGTGMASH